jgi:hypothetical protein
MESNDQQGFSIQKFKTIISVPSRLNTFRHITHETFHVL